MKKCTAIFYVILCTSYGWLNPFYVRKDGWTIRHDEIDSCSVVSEGEYDYFLSLRCGCSAHQSISPNDLLSLKYRHHAHLIDGIADYQLFFKLSLDVLAHIDDNSALSVKVSELLIYNNISVSSLVYFQYHIFP